MISKRSLTGGLIVLPLSLALGLAGITPASAATNPSDPTFTPNALTDAAPDFVGVGSDTTQVAMHYLAEGFNGTPGYNQGKTGGRIASFAADGDPASIVLRSGTSAITRPNGSGSGKAKLYAPDDTAAVSFARSSSALSTGEIAASLQAFPFAVDGLKAAVSSSSTNAPATLTIDDLVKIYNGTYTTWNQIPGNSAGSTATIKPLIPQSGSGTRAEFEKQLKAGNGGNAVTLAPSVVEVQEHDPAPIQNDPNAVGPFSTGRAASAPTIKLLGGFSYQRALYNVLRNADASKAGYLAIFGPDGFICSPAARPLIAAAGFGQMASAANGGACGVPTQSAETNFKLSEAAQTTATTTQVGAVSNGTNVTLTATVAPSAAAGKVAFFEGATKVGEKTVSSGTASLTLTGVSAGAHSYTATFTPTSSATYSASQGSASVTVDPSDIDFSDVSSSKSDPSYSPFATEITWMATEGISRGYPQQDGTVLYKPRGSVTRDAMAAFLYRAAGEPEVDTSGPSPFADVAKSNQFYKEIVWMYNSGTSTGWVEKNGTRTYRPSNKIARDAMAAFLFRLAEETDYTAPTKSPFADIPTTRTFYKEIAWMAEAGISTGYAVKGGAFEYRPLNATNRDAMAAFLYRFFNPSSK